MSKLMTLLLKTDRDLIFSPHFYSNFLNIYHIRL